MLGERPVFAVIEVEVAHRDLVATRPVGRRHCFVLDVQFGSLDS